MDATMKIAVILSAFDKMSSVVDSATENAQKKLRGIMGKNFIEGTAMIETGRKIIGSLEPAVKAYADLEQSSIDLKAAMMDSTGAVNENYEKIDSLAEKLGNALPGTTADFHQLFEAMFNNGIKAQQILKGVGQAAAYLAVDLKMPYTQAGIFAAKMQQATGVADNEMLKFMDTISRVNALGVDASEMQYAFGRSAGTLKSLGLQGLEASKSIAVLYAQLIRTGQTGETSASSFNNIMAALLDPKKYDNFAAMADQLGVKFSFFRNGKFLGVENMIQQFDKLKDLSTTKKAQIINALTGGGQDAQAMSTLVSAGTDGYRKMRAEMEKKAALDDKIKLKLQGLNAMWEATTGTITNMIAALGAGLAPILSPLIQKIGDMAGVIQDWLKQNPAMARFISMAVTLTGVAVTMFGIIKVIKGIQIAMQLLNLTLEANLFLVIAAAAILAISLIYANWDKISAWFAALWNKIKAIFSAVWNRIKNMFLNYTPQGLIIKHWEKIVSFFANIWDGVKSGIIAIGRWFYNLNQMFFNAGKNIINSVWSGIKSFVNKPYEAVKAMVQKIRNLLPFSPAKDGPLRDIHKIRLVETIAESIKPNALVNKMRHVAQLTFDTVSKRPSGPRPAGATQANTGSGGITFNITLNGGATKQDASLVMQEIEKRFPQLMNKYQARQARVLI